MSNITWRKSSELIDLKELIAHRQDFTLYGVLEKISLDETSVRIKLVDKDKEWHGLWFSITDNFALDPLKETEYPLLELNAKIETFFGKDGLLRTKITLTQWKEAEAEPESTKLTLTDMTVMSNLTTDQRGLCVLGLERQVDVGYPGNEKTITERYYIRWYESKESTIKSTKADITFNLRLTKYQINAEGIRHTGIENYEYENGDGVKISGQRNVYWLCLEAESIDWK